MLTQTLIFLPYSSLLILLIFLQTCNAKCIPSACGEVRNISSPFRLKSDPRRCGDRRAELVCKNNLTSINRHSQKYYVKSIDYHRYEVRVTHAAVYESSSVCAFFSPSEYSDPFSWGTSDTYVKFLSCAYPLSNLSELARVTGCEEEGAYRYVKLGIMNPQEVPHMCTVGAGVATSWNFSDTKSNLSISEIRESLLYGYTVSWLDVMCSCRYCYGGTLSYGLVTCDGYTSDLNEKWDSLMNKFKRPYEGPVAGYLMVFMIVVAIVFVGISIPTKIIVGFGSFYLFLVKIWYRSDIQRIIDYTFGIRFSVGFLCAMGFLIYKFRRRRMSAYEEIEDFLQSDEKLMPIRYSYSDIKKMIKGFREKLGQGGFGTVYKGKLRSGHYVAVKLLWKGTTKGQDFINEIGTIGRIHHVNAVKLVGYCAERSKRGLIFDFMPNGSLEKYIFNRENTRSLDLDKKFKIVIGVARGIEYLHCGCDMQILHFDIKPHNILLDENFVPKVSDFGLAKLCSIEKDNVTLTAVRGTIGYVAPELINRSIGAVSYKADVYSFGMLLMEMLGLNREFKGAIDHSTKYFPQWIYESFNQGKDIEIEKVKVSNGNDDNESTNSLVRKMTIVALWCIQTNPNDRPSMNKVLQMLEDDVECLQIPEYPSELAHMVVVEEESWVTTSIDSASLLHFNNDTSIDITIA